MADLKNDFDNIVHLVAGSNEMHALKFGAAVAANESFEAGSLVSLDAHGKVVKGCATTAMPLWAINGTPDYDVRRDEWNIGGGKVNCFVATGGFELFTTAFDTTEGVTYAPNTKLVPGTSTLSGKVTAASATVAGYAAQLLCGVVSRGIKKDTVHGTRNVLYFWPILQFPVTT
jgi:hypothetical protein